MKKLYATAFVAAVIVLLIAWGFAIAEAAQSDHPAGNISAVLAVPAICILIGAVAAYASYLENVRLEERQARWDARDEDNRRWWRQQGERHDGTDE